MNNNSEPMAELQYSDCNITLLGTAHVSRISAEQVRNLLPIGHKFDAVAIELCTGRYKSISDPDALSKLDLFQVIREKKAAMVAAHLALGAYQQRLAEDLGIEPGAEMRAAIAQTDVSNTPLLLIDREVGTTLRRVYARTPWWKRMYLLSGLLVSVVGGEKVSEEDIEQLKEGDMLETAFAQFADKDKELFEPLIDERDRYMCARLQQEINRHGYKRVLVVIGAGHLRGMSKYLSSSSINNGIKHADMIVEELDHIPPPGRLRPLLPWLITILVLLGFGIGFSRSPELGWTLIADWVLINGSLSALGALLAAAHPITIITAFLAAPLTSLNPTIGAGMVTGAVEAWIRKPNVGDFSTLRHDASSLKGWWNNRVTRVLLVFLFSTIGSAAGTYIAGFRIAKQLAG
ncbi:MAG: TraB/GumN family protein [Mariprofundales bacterium]